MALASKRSVLVTLNAAVGFAQAQFSYLAPVNYRVRRLYIRWDHAGKAEVSTYSTAVCYRVVQTHADFANDCALFFHAK